VADPEQVEILKKGAAEWNAWRGANPTIRPYLRDAYLRDAYLMRANLSNANLTDAYLTDAYLSRADLGHANLTDANLTGAYLMRANLSNANLPDANLSRADLRNAILIRADLRGAHLRGADLSNANLTIADLTGAHLRGAHLNNANLSHANLTGANFRGADLGRANLTDANLTGANLFDASLRNIDLSDANLTTASFGETVFADVDLSTVIGLDTCVHQMPSPIDYRTLQKSGPLPLAFLRGVGLPDNFIEYLPSLFNQAIQLYSCFISYRAKGDDEEFAKRLYDDLQGRGVRCWLDKHDLRTGDKIRDVIDAAIRSRDKLMLILSEHSIASDWVENEVEQAFEEERKRGETVLFPICIDEAWKDTNKAWAAALRRRRHIGDFTGWRNPDSYKRSFERALRDLTVKPKAP
jgi:uncharacterized protein YjbI with pentapeptide repeats